MLKDEQEELDSRSPEAEAIVPAVTPADLLNVGDVLLNLDGAGSDEDKSYRAAITSAALSGFRRWSFSVSVFLRGV